MTTIERPIETPERATAPAPVTTPTRPARRWLSAVVAVLALVVGMAVGWFARGGEDDPDVMAVGGGSLTDRQDQMVDMAMRYDDAFIANDSEAVLSMFVPNGYITMGGLDVAYRANDGTLASFVEDYGYSSLTQEMPMLVLDDTVLFVHTYGTQPALSALTFTTSGDVLIIEHAMYNVF